MTDQLTSYMNVLKELEDSKEPFSEYTVASALRKFMKANEPTSTPEELAAELMAFEFSESNQEPVDGWGNYFRPMFTWKNAGQNFETPSIKDVTPATITYWEKRAKETTHPVLRARYSDLVWDLSKIVTGNEANFSLAALAIDSIIEIARRNCYECDVGVFGKLNRALSLSISLNDPKRIETVCNAILAFEDAIAEDDKAGTWGYAFDYLWNNKKVILSESQKRKIIGDLENRLDRFCGPVEKGTLNPWAIERAGLKLANHYRILNQHEEIKRVLVKIGAAYEKMGENASPLLLSIWLQHVYSIYKEYGLTSEGDQIAVRLRELGPKAMAELKPVSHSVKITKEEMDEYVSNIIEGDLNTALARIATHFVPRKDKVEEQLQHLSKIAPISFLFSKQLLAHEGRIEANVGNLENDLDGNIANQISQNMQIESIFLRCVLDGVINKYNLTAQQLTDHVFQSPIFDEDSKPIIHLGLQAYFDGNQIVAIHLLVLQVEKAIRCLVERTGGSVMKQVRGGGLHLKNLDDLLRDPRIAAVFGEDATIYLKILLTDQRGWNIRNNVCHAIWPSVAYGVTITDRVLHALLCLALVREKRE